MSGSITPDGNEIKRLRKKLGLTVQQLAKKAHLSERTLNSLEAGRDCYPNSLQKLALVFDVDYGELHIPIPGSKRFDVAFHLDKKFADFDETQLPNLVEFLRYMLHSRSEIVVRFIKDGSVILTLEMEEEDIVELARVLPDLKRAATGKRGEVNKYAAAGEIVRSIIEVQFPNDPGFGDDKLRGKFLAG